MCEPIIETIEECSSQSSKKHTPVELQNISHVTTGVVMNIPQECHNENTPLCVSMLTIMRGETMNPTYVHDYFISNSQTVVAREVKIHPCTNVVPSSQKTTPLTGYNCYN